MTKPINAATGKAYTFEEIQALYDSGQAIVSNAEEGTVYTLDELTAIYTEAEQAEPEPAPVPEPETTEQPETGYVPQPQPNEVEAGDDAPIDGAALEVLTAAQAEQLNHFADTGDSYNFQKALVYFLTN